jgi:hypothetical protein
MENKKGWSNKKAKKVIITMSSLWGFVFIPYYLGRIFEIMNRQEFLTVADTWGFGVATLAMIVLVFFVPVKLLILWINE